MPPRKETTGAALPAIAASSAPAPSPASATSSPPAPAPPDQIPDQIVAHFRVTDDGLTVDARMPDSFPRLMAAFGTKDRDFFWGLTNQITDVKTRKNDREGTNFLLSVLKTKQPRDELEAMLLAQMAVCHKVTMDLTAQLNHLEDVRLLAKLMKTFADLKESFDRGRRATEQSVMVQNMTVKDGGQAIVGNVTQRSTEPDEGKIAASILPLTDARAVPLARVGDSPELAPAAQQREESQTCDKKR